MLISIGKALTGEVALGPRSEGGEGTNHAVIWRKEHSSKGKNKCQGSDDSRVVTVMEANVARVERARRTGENKFREGPRARVRGPSQPSENLGLCSVFMGRQWMAGS